MKIAIVFLFTNFIFTLLFDAGGRKSIATKEIYEILSSQTPEIKVFSKNISIEGKSRFYLTSSNLSLQKFNNCHVPNLVLKVSETKLSKEQLEEKYAKDKVGNVIEKRKGLLMVKLGDFNEYNPSFSLFEEYPHYQYGAIYPQQARYQGSVINFSPKSKAIVSGYFSLANIEENGNYISNESNVDLDLELTISIDCGQKEASIYNSNDYDGVYVCDQGSKNILLKQNIFYYLDKKDNLPSGSSYSILYSSGRYLRLVRPIAFIEPGKLVIVSFSAYSSPKAIECKK